jgi:hypothetical protein
MNTYINETFFLNFDFKYNFHYPFEFDELYNCFSILENSDCS